MEIGERLLPFWDESGQNRDEYAEATKTLFGRKAMLNNHRQTNTDYRVHFIVINGSGNVLELHNGRKT